LRERIPDNIAGQVFHGLFFSGMDSGTAEDLIRAFEAMANLATKAGVEDKKIAVHAPLVDLTKAQIIRKGVGLGVEFGITHSCYDPSPNGRACGSCDSCLLREKGFAEAGTKDPTSYLK